MHMQAQENPEETAAQPEPPKHVILFSFNPQLKAMVRYDALVIGTRDFEENDRPVLNLVHFRHDDIASHHALNGVDWADTLERTLDVPHQCDLEQQSFYYLEGDAETLEQQLEQSREVLREYDKVVDNLKAQLRESHDSLQSAADVVAELTAQLATTTEGKDAALQQLADANANAMPASGPQLVEASPKPAEESPTPLPSGDLVTTETKQYSDGSSATGPGPLPDLSPAQQEALEPSASTE